MENHQYQVLVCVLLVLFCTAYTEAGSLIQPEPAHFMRGDGIALRGSYHTEPPQPTKWSVSSLIYSFKALWTDGHAPQTIDEGSNHEADSCTITGNESLDSCGSQFHFRIGKDETLSSRLKAKKMSIPDFEDEF